MMLGVALAMIFVFFIGTVAISGKTESSSDIFYFFGEYYDEIKAVDFSQSPLTEWFQDLTRSQLNLFGVFGTVIGAVTLLCVLSFGIVAIIMYLLGWTKKKPVKNGWALASILSFLGGSILFYSHTNEIGNFDGSADILATLQQMGLGGEVVTKFNGSTITAIVLCSIAVVAWICMRLIGGGKAVWAKQNLPKIICSFIGVALAGVALGLAQGATFGFSLSTSALQGETLSFKGTSNSGYLMFNGTIDLLFGALYTDKTDDYATITAVIQEMNVFNVILAVLVVAFTVLAALALAYNIRGVTGEKNRAFAFTISVVVVAIASLVFVILSWNNFSELMDMLIVEGAGTEVSSNYETRLHFGNIVCALVFSLLLLSGAIVEKVISKNKD